MSDKLQKNTSGSLKEKTQYGLTFGVIAMMLFVAGFPMVVIFFFGIFAYFLWKTFSSSPQSNIREIFEFYLSANEILRDDERRWFGFEIQETIVRGERILHSMHGAPPLVYFSLGALYNKIENHEAAINHLTYVVENDNSDESTYIHPSADLRNYVNTLRKIERDPKTAPQTSAAIRALERARKNRGRKLLEESQQKLQELESSRNFAERKQILSDEQPQNPPFETSKEESILKTVNESDLQKETSYSRNNTNGVQTVRRKNNDKKESIPKKNDDEMFAKRKPITEVLHDIYDKNVQ